MYYRKTFLLVMLCLLSTQAYAQGRQGEDFSFTIEAPNIAEQGTPFSICYRLKATHWDKWEMPKSDRGFSLTDVSYTTQTNNTIHTLEIKATALTSMTGDIELPRIPIPIDGKMVYAESKFIHVNPNSTCGEEMTAAHKWLVKQGCHPDSVILQVEHREQTLTLFTNANHQNFAVVANKQYWPLVGNPILAFSTLNNFVIRKGDGRDYADLLQPFSKQIQTLAMSPQPQPVPEYLITDETVSPILADIRWGQHTPYNYMAPVMQHNSRKSNIGCLPLAMAMVMSAHQWPVTGQSHAYYKIADELHRIDFSDISPQWGQYQDSYDKNDTIGVKNLSRLLVSIGMAIDASFNSQATSATLNRVKQVLCGNFSYSGKTTLLKDPSTSELIGLLREELNARRPCIVANDTHAFVCDGYWHDFFHFNMGWYGQSNGYYRLLLGTGKEATEAKHPWLKTIIYGITPNYQPTTKEITLTDAGTLSSQLTQEEMENTTMLRVTGYLNTADLLLLRKMAGAENPANDSSSWHGGALRFLDLKDAAIVADKRPYHSRQATSTWTHIKKQGRQQNKVTYDFKNMTEAQWEHFKEDIGEEQEGYSYTRAADNNYWIHYHCTDSVIGKYMFAGCTSLAAIRLPEQTKKIDDYAFMECASLREVVIPTAVQQLGALPFYFCHSLEKIELPSHTTTDKKGIAENCSPALKIQRGKE